MKNRVFGYKATKIAFFGRPLIRTMRKFVFLLQVFISSYMKNKIFINFFTFWDFFRAIRLKIRNKLSFFRTLSSWGQKKLKNTKVITNDMKQLSGGIALFSPPYYVSRVDRIFWIDYKIGFVPSKPNPK
jgi:hypothetical protein